jgi:hypothetical protein
MGFIIASIRNSKECGTFSCAPLRRLFPQKK